MLPQYPKHSAGEFGMRLGWFVIGAVMLTVGCTSSPHVRDRPDERLVRLPPLSTAPINTVPPTSTVPTPLSDPPT